MTGKAASPRWITTAALVELSSAALPRSESGMLAMIEREGWRGTSRARLLPGRGRAGGTWEFHHSLLPAEVRAALVGNAARAEDEGEAEAARAAIWAQYEALPDRTKEKTRARLKIVNEVTTLRAGGMEASLAVTLMAKRAEVSTSTIWNWLKRIDGVARADREPALADRPAGRAAVATCDPQAWAFLKADYLRPEQPTFAACYRRLKDAAKVHGWSPVPSAKTLHRRLKREVPRGARVMARGGRNKAKAIFPHQTRDRSVFTAMQAVNADGHRFDVFCRWPDGHIARPMMVAVQDLYSGMIVGHRIDQTENWGSVRHAFGDMAESFGIPEHVWLDNGRAFASKWLTGGMQTRFRFKVRDDDPEGLLTQLGVQVHWATPYHGQAKPIERAFRDMCEEIAKHPACAGAYTGNSPMAKPDNYGKTAVPIEIFRDLVASEIARHNSRTGRQTAVAKGRSFHQVFNESLAAAGTVVTRATAAQLRMFLLAAEGVTARKPTGEVHLAGNRYWAEPMADLAGRRVVVRFDPDDLLAPAAIYASDGRFVCEAPCIEATGFDDMEAAREHARRRRQWMKATREVLDLEKTMSIGQVAALLPRPSPATPAATHEPVQVVRLVANGNGQVDAGIVVEEDSEAGRDRHAQSFGKAVRALADGDVVPFEKRTRSGN